MANGLMSDLKEFGQNFLLSAGAGLAKNIQEAGERDRKDILDATKELKGTIARNKAADAKITADLKSKLTTLRTALPGGNLDFYKTVMSSDANFNRVMKAVDDDVNKTGSWFRDSASEFNISDPSSIYKALDGGGKKVKLSDIRTRTTTGPSKADLERDDSEDWKRTILGMRLDPDQVMTKVYKKIAMGGRNAIGPDDLQYAYGVPTRGIIDSGLPLNIRKEEAALGTTQTQAISKLYNSGFGLELADPEDTKELRRITKQYNDLLDIKNRDPRQQEELEAVYKNKQLLTRNILEINQPKIQKILDVLGRNTGPAALRIIDSMKDLSPREKKIAKTGLTRYQNYVNNVLASKQVKESTTKQALGMPKPPFADMMPGYTPPPFTTDR
tara:strand:+ start:63 stop:1220 length:1158 start_codon:yes stop_codon:yes gene_type:complete